MQRKAIHVFNLYPFIFVFIVSCLLTFGLWHCLWLCIDFVLYFSFCLVWSLSSDDLWSWHCIWLRIDFVICLSLCLVLSCLVLSCLVLSCLVLSCLVLSCLVSSCLVLSLPKPTFEQVVLPVLGNFGFEKPTWQIHAFRFCSAVTLFPSSLETRHPHHSATYPFCFC